MSNFEGTTNNGNKKSKGIIIALIAVIVILAVALVAVFMMNSNKDKTPSGPDVSDTEMVNDENNANNTIDADNSNDAVDLHPGELTLYNGSVLRIGDKFSSAKNTGFNCDGIDDEIPEEQFEFAGCGFVISDDDCFDGNKGELLIGSDQQKKIGDTYADMTIDGIEVEMEEFETAHTGVTVLGGISTDTSIDDIENILNRAGLKKDTSFNIDDGNYDIDSNTYAVYGGSEVQCVLVHITDANGNSYYYIIDQMVKENNITYNNICIASRLGY